MSRFQLLFFSFFFTFIISCKNSSKEEALATENFIEKANIDTVKKVANQPSETNDFKIKTNLINAQDFEKWTGKYFASFIESQGEGPYNTVIELNIESPSDCHFQVYYQNLNDTIKQNKMKIYGSFQPLDKTNSAIEFLPEVLYEGEDNGLDQGFKLYEKDGKYFIKTDMVVPDNVPKNRIPIRKILNQ